MKKEKTVRTYQRRTKSGKIVTVRQHTASYDAAEKAMEAAKKKGAGDELEARKKKLAMEQLAGKKASEELEKELLEKEKDEKSKEEKPKKETKKVKPVGSGTNGPVRKSKKESKDTTEQPFTAAEFKEWYRGTGSAADKKVAKALRAQLGRSGYRKLEDEAIDNYSSRGHLSMFKRVSGGSEVSAKTAKEKTSKIDPKVVRGYAKDEDISVKDARKELSAMTSTERNKHIKYYSKKDKESKDRVSKISEGTKGIDASMKKLPSGGKALTGKDATAAKKVLMDNGYEVLRIDGKTFLKKGNSTYEYKSAGLRLGGAMLKKSKVNTSKSKEVSGEKSASPKEKESPSKTTKETSSKTAKSRLKQLRGELAALKQKEDESRPKPPKGFKEAYLGVKEGSATFKKLWGHPDYGHGFNLATGKHDFFYEPKSKSKSKPADTGKSIYKVAKKIEKEERRSYQEKYGVTHKEITDSASSEGYYFSLGSFYKKKTNNIKGPYMRPYQYFAKKAAQQTKE